MRLAVDIWIRNPFGLLNKTQNVPYSPAFLIYCCVLQKFFDLERENVCATKEQKDHSFPKLNRNKYMVTDGAAYIGRYQGCQTPRGSCRSVTVQVPLCSFIHSITWGPWRKQDREVKQLLELNISSRAWLK